jgi:hypothetical protein
MYAGPNVFGGPERHPPRTTTQQNSRVSAALFFLQFATSCSRNRPVGAFVKSVNILSAISTVMGVCCIT